MNQPFLSVRDLTVRFAGTTAIEHIDLDVMHDELLVVLGPTGAGKTTLLRTLAGLQAPDAGRVTMAGEDVTTHSPARRDVALVFQNFSLYSMKSVRQNLVFPLQAPGRDMSAAEIAQRVAWVASLLRIEHLLDRPSSRLSGGEMQRVAIGRALVRRPRLFLMDEPLTNLDAKLRESLRVEIVKIRRELGTPMIFVTHDQAEALSMGDRVVVLSQGRLLQTGSPEQIYRRPASPEVARQLGQPKINQIDVKRVDSRWVTASGEAVAGAGIASAPRAILGIRPENLSIAGGATAGTVELVEDMGPHLVLVVRWLGQRVHIVADKHTSIHPGDTIHPCIDESHMIVWPR